MDELNELLIIFILIGLVFLYFYRIKSESIPNKHCFYIDTSDGAKLALYRYQASPAAVKKSEPILMLSGFGINHLILDFDEQSSWARSFAQQGFDTWLLDLRRSGLSTGANSRDGSFDDYVLDAKTAINYILNQTQAEKVHWFGYSLGGMLLYAILSVGAANQIRSGVCIEAPITLKDYPIDNMSLSILKLINVCGFIREIPYRFILRLIIPIAQYLYHTASFRIWMNIDNIDLKRMPKMLYWGFDNVPVALALQLKRWTMRDGLTSLDGKIDYLGGLSHSDVPILILTGNNDFSIRALKVKPLLNPLCQSVQFNKLNGYAVDYGHADLILGKNALQELFPFALDWIKQADNQLLTQKSNDQ